MLDHKAIRDIKVMLAMLGHKDTKDGKDIKGILDHKVSEDIKAQNQKVPLEKLLIKVQRQ